MAKNKPTEERVPGQGTILSQETVTKMQDLTEKVDSISGKVGTGVIAAKLALDGIGAVRTAFNDGIDGPLYDAIQDLKRQAKDKAITRVKEEIPTKQEIIDKLRGYSCDINVMRAVKKAKELMEAILNKGKSTIESISKKLEKIQEKMEKAAEFITTITLVLGVFSVLVTALEILIVAATLALNFFTSLFAAAGPENAIAKAITKAEGFCLKYTGLIKSYTNKLLKTITKVMIIFNFIPKIIQILKTILDMIVLLLELIERYFNEYMEDCNPDNVVSTDENGNVVIDNSALDNYLNPDLSNTGDGKVDRYGRYIYDTSEKQRRIYKPKLN